MSSDNLKGQARRTEEVQDIIDRMPYRTGRIIAILVTGLSVLLIFFGWIIEYPETCIPETPNKPCLERIT